MDWVEVYARVGEEWPWIAPVLGVVLGAVAGSFLTCAVTRIPVGMSLWQPPSHCDACRRALGVVDLIPIVSWLVGRGRCRTCANPIGVKMLALEMVSAAVGGMMGYVVGLSWSTFPVLIILLTAYVLGMLYLLVRR